mgnify:CR=1 FL=1
MCFASSHLQPRASQSKESLLAPDGHLSMFSPRVSFQIYCERKSSSDVLLHLFGYLCDAADGDDDDGCQPPPLLLPFDDGASDDDLEASEVGGTICHDVHDRDHAPELLLHQLPLLRVESPLLNDFSLDHGDRT